MHIVRHNDNDNEFEVKRKQREEKEKKDARMKKVKVEAEEWLKSMERGIPLPPPSSSARIKRVPQAMRKNDDYEKYYVPKVVSIGPYHCKRESLVKGNRLKRVCATSFLLQKEEEANNLYNKLGDPDMVQKLRDFYEENSTKEFCDKEFTRMMLQDGCFILYYIQMFCFRGAIISRVLNLNDQEINFINQDLLLLENQIPLIVLHEVAKIKKSPFHLGVFIDHSNILGTRMVGNRSFKIGGVQPEPDYDHLLHCWHVELTTPVELDQLQSSMFNLPAIRTVNELMDAGIHFRPLSNVKTLSDINFFRGWKLISATLKLPPITVEDSTKTTLLNLLAYEMCSVGSLRISPVVSSYMRLLRYLINQPNDVKALREARVLQHSLGSDNEVVKLFKELGSDLKPEYDLTYLKAMRNIESHYHHFRKFNTVFSELKREYFKSPWTFFALVGAIVALFLTAVQTYFAVWSPKAECDDLCKFLKMNNHV